ncbi:Mpv17/PMP22-like protein 4 [Elsinoe fawcettii]|nr:Mpv17/PMP22-like protein 4 [Elsinoe fawcettii]
MVSLDLIIKSTLQAVTLSAISNILAQAITSYQTNTPFHLDPAPLTRFIIFSLLSCPPNVLWQSYLETRFPGYEPTPFPSANGPPKPRPPPPGKKKLNKTNTAIKWVLDQTFGAVLNTAAFVGGMLLLRGERDWAVIGEAVRTETWPLMVAGQKLWPLFSVVSFTLIPLEYRTLAGGIVGTGWGVYLSLVEGKKKEA